MLAVIGGLAGFFSSLVPEVFNFMKDKKDKEHELKLISLQIEAAKTNQNSRLEEVRINADIEESKYLYMHAAPTRIKWVDSVSALVRPLITYMFFMAYIYLKVTANKGVIAEIWTQEDQAIFCTVIGFWFGQRAFGKAKGGRY
jgi:hypothetical protein